MEIELNNPIITKMAMHVVGEDGREDARHLPSTNVVHQQFFLERIAETVKGCKCTFIDASGVKPVLKDITTSQADFYLKSKSLADSFHLAITAQGAAIPGAFLLFEIDNSGEKIYSIIKYEHDDVVHYKKKTDDHGNESLVFELLDTTFVKKPQAMQKSALIKFNDQESIIHVIDRSERKGITKYFRAYLGANRLFDDIEVTEKFVKAVDGFVDRAIKNELLPRDIKRIYKTRMYEYAQNDDAKFDPENIPVFLTSLVGSSNEQMVAVFESELKKNRIEGEKFGFNKQYVPKPSKYRTRTKDGIEINFTQSHIDSGKYLKEGGIIKIDISAGLDEDANQMG